MSNESIILLVAACSGVFGIAAWVGLLAIPAWQSYSRVWERVGAVFLSLYVVAAFMAAGALLGALVVWLWAS
jgi:hypothetical protein